MPSVLDTFLGLVDSTLCDEEAARQHGSAARVPSKSTGRAPWPASHPWKRYAKLATEKKAARQKGHRP